MQFLKNWRNESYHLNYGEKVIDKYSNMICKNLPVKVIDLGCGGGRDLKIIKKISNHVETELFGINFDPLDDIKITNIDLEFQEIPFEDNVFDVSICNQVFEHLKNWIWALQEQIRVTKIGGYLIIGVPNLGALHCRIQLLMGIQPSCIKADDAHVRGFTVKEFKRIINQVKGLRIISIDGGNMYGFPPKLANKLSVLCPEMSVSIFFLIKKTSNENDLIKIIKSKKLETNYFLGN